MLILLSFILLSAAIPSTLGRPDGAPEAACSTIAPSLTWHGATPQSGLSPFTIDVTTDTYHPGEEISGNIFSDMLYIYMAPICICNSNLYV